jgi:biopolymer transport protein TolR
MAKKHRLASDINVVPYIDVMLVLLVIFMVTAPLLTQGVKVDLPKANAEVVDSKEEPIIVSMKADGQLFVNLGEAKDTAVSLEDIKVQISKVLKAAPETPVLIWADTHIEYGKVVKLMANLQSGGVKEAGLVNDPDA